MAPFVGVSSTGAALRREQRGRAAGRGVVTSFTVWVLAQLVPAGNQRCLAGSCSAVRPVFGTNRINCSTTMRCFKSPDPDAVNSTVLYDYNNDEDNLWIRNDTAGPLQSCFPLRDQQFPCTVCLHDGTVYAMCKKLADGVRMVMEAVGKSVRISSSDCPAPPGDAHQAGIIVAFVLFVLLVIIGVLLYCKCCKNRKEQTRRV